MADEESGGEVRVRLSQEGAEELVSRLKEIIEKLNETGEAAKKTSENTEKMGGAMGGMSTALGITALATGATAVMEFGSKAIETAEKVWELAASFVEAAAEQERFTIQMAALEEATLGWESAMMNAEKNLQGLKDMNILGSEEELATTFRKVTLMVGGTDAAIADLTKRMGFLAEQSGVTTSQLLRVIQMAERTGSLPMRGEMAFASLAIKNAGISGEDIKQAAAAAAGGQSDALEKLLDKIKVTDDATKAMSESWDNLHAQWERAKGDLSDVIGAGFKPLKEVMIDLINLLKSDTVRNAVKSFSDTIKESIEDTIQTVKNLSELIDHVGRSWGIAKRYFSTAPGDSFGAVQDASKEETDRWGAIQAEKEWREKIKAMRKGMVGGDADEGLRGEFGDVPERKPIVDLDKQLKAATESFDELYKKMSQKFDLAGLDGLDKKLKEIELSAKAEIEQLDKAEKKITEAGGHVDAGKDRALRRGIENTKMFEMDKAHADETAKLMKEEAAAEEKYLKQRIDLNENTERLITDMRKRGETDVLAIIDAQTDAEIEQMGKRVEKLKEQEDKLFVEQTNGYQADLTAWMEVQARKGALDKAFTDFEIDAKAKAAQRKKEIEDQEFGNYEAYYDDLLQKARDTHQNMFVAAQEASRHVADLMEKQAQTGADGWAAGLAKIQAATTSFGQDVAVTVGEMWKSLGTAFETGFYDVMTGKFDSLKDVLKSLWDSILKDFSKMLAQMLERWILTGDAMGNGQGDAGGIFAKLLGGGKGGGNTAVYTPGGTAATSPGQTVGQTGQGGIPGLQGGAPLVGGQQAGGGGAAALGGVMALGTLYNDYSTIMKATGSNKADIKYGDQNLGTADFGGNAKFGDFAGAAAATVAVATLGAAAIGAAVASVTAFSAAAVAAVVPVVGWVIAAVLLVVGAIMAIFSGPHEGHIYVAISDAFEKSGAKSAAGGLVETIIDSTANFVGRLALKAAGPDGVQKYVSTYQAAFKEAYGNAKFDFAAGSAEDLQKDVENFFKQTLPTMAMRAAFGQVGYDPNGNRDNPGGVAGMDWNLNNGAMDKDGNFIKKQLYDPNAPIPLMLTGLGFSAEKIGEIATKLASGGDIEAFKKYLEELVGVVVDMGDLAKKFGRTTGEWMTALAETESKQGTAAQFTDQIKNLKASGTLLETMFGDERVTAAKQLVQDSGTLLNSMAQALDGIRQMIDSIKESTKQTIAGYKNKLLTPAEREAEARADYTTDVAAIATAANPKEVQAAWQQVMKDLSAVLDAIVARINAIKSLQQGYSDFRDLMAKNAGPQFGTDPSGWLAQNSADIAKVTDTLKTAVGDDAVKAAGELLSLTKERYANEVAQLQKINGLIQSITETGQQTSDNLKMQGMGSVVTDPTTGKKTWVADTHAQGEYLKGQYDDLMKQLGTATTPEQVQKIYQKMQGIISQLAAQPQDPEHYAESRQILSGMNDAATKAATDLLKKWGKDLDTDIAGTGDKLKAGEEALSKALEAAQKDFDKNLGLMSDASNYATDALTVFADGLTAAMQNVGKVIEHWSFVMTHPDTEKDPNWDYDKNAPKGGYTAPPETDKWEDDPDDPGMQICTAGPNKGKKRKKPGAGPGHGPDNQNPATAPGGAPANATTPGATTPGSVQADLDAYKKALAAAASPSVTVTVNSGTAEEIAQAAADATYESTLEAIKANNVELVRTLRNNPALITPTWQAAAR